MSSTAAEVPAKAGAAGSVSKQVRAAGICLFSALGSFLFGMDMGYIGPILQDPGFKRDVARLADWEEPGSLIPGAEAGWIVSVFSLGCILTSFPVVSSFFLDTWGRKASIMVGSAVFACGAAVQASAGGIPHMALGRFIQGCSIGILSTVVPLYQTELAPRELRGALTSLSQVLIALGVAVAALLDQVLLPLEDGWRCAVLLPIGPSIVLLTGMVLLPGSPRWLVQRGRVETARKVLHSLRDEAVAEEELREIVADQEAARLRGKPAWRDLCSGRTCRLLLVGVALQFLQQVTGINAFVSYGPRVFQSLGLPANLLQTLMNTAMFVCTIPAMYLVEHAGRRTLLLAGAIGMLVANVAMAVLGVVYTRHHEEHVEVLSPTAGWLIVVAVFLFAMNFAYSWGPTTWVYCAEIFPLHVRSRCVGLTTMAEWVGVFAVNQGTPMLLSSIGFAAFFVSGGCCLLAAVLAAWLPETKGVLLEHVGHVFDARFGGVHIQKGATQTVESEGGNQKDTDVNSTSGSSSS